MGATPPEVVMIEFDPKDVEAFIQAADAIEEAFPAVVVQGNEQGDGRAGSFEVATSDGHQVYSKLAGQSYPTIQDLIDRIANRSSPAATEQVAAP
eukprot:CAMPEP_0119106768 /NCGR_PEP_ID=MMETSP1180-20130426/6310_1 /TAXON_ID=3052 ORGANISM="Chlamydomonas cf sp, Strain CCMP681" /NCGR_SAMPLE_ID=MMETSP1180 /ASSEMBLY_ACC=CAM_ASM_000741 /LENGTH=94 /DNA_ID=CAMNT_0007092155 /DNA_START=196 /DNA_END=480 /DNA_ORIENTATION=-